MGKNNCTADTLLGIEPIKKFTDEEGNFWIEFKSNEVKELLEKYKTIKK